MIIEIVFVLRGIKDMKLKHKIDKVVSTISERISSGGVSQLEVKAEGERDIFGNMPNLIREAAGEGIVLLKNNNALPYNKDTKISVFGRCQLDYFYVGYGSGGDENGFFRWLFNWLFGSKDKEEEPAPVYSGWRTENGKTYYYAQDTNKKVTGLRSIDGKLYYFDANGVKQDNVTFGIDVSKYQSGLDWNKIKKSGVSFVIIRIGYRGYGAAGNLVKDPMFEEHFTNARNAGLKVGVYFFTQAVNEAEAQEEADGCNWALNGRMLDYPIFYDTEASTAPHGTGRADGLGVEDRTKCAIAFCERVKELGYKPGVYASTTWYRKRVDYNTLRSRYTIWNAHYGVSSSPIGCDLWQGTEKARINGYSGELDANISYIG